MLLRFIVNNDNFALNLLVAVSVASGKWEFSKLTTIQSLRPYNNYEPIKSYIYSIEYLLYAID